MEQKKQNYSDFLIECYNPKAFDQTVNSMGAMLQQNVDDSYFKTPEGYYVMRVLSDPGYVQFAIKNQGYGKVIKQIEASGSK